MQNGIKHVVNLVDWEEKSKERDKFFSKRFALVLERAFNEIQEDKQRLKDSIRKFYGESKVPKTPKRKNPTEALLKQIEACKTISFVSDDDDEAAMSGIKAKELSKELLFVQKLQQMGLNSRPKILFDEEVPQNSKISLIMEEVDVVKQNLHAEEQVSPKKVTLKLEPSKSTRILAKPVSLVKKTRINNNAVGVTTTLHKVVVGSKFSRNSLLRKKKLQQLVKQQENEDKNAMAIQQKNNLLKERVEATKREREERQRRVEQNNKIKEALAREKVEFQRAQAERIRQFHQLEAEKNMPSYSSFKHLTPSKQHLTPAHKSPAPFNFKPLDLAIESPGSIAVPKKRSKPPAMAVDLVVKSLKIPISRSQQQDNNSSCSAVVAAAVVAPTILPQPQPKSPAYIVNFKQLQKAKPQHKTIVPSLLSKNNPAQPPQSQEENKENQREMNLKKSLSPKRVSSPIPRPSTSPVHQQSTITKPLTQLNISPIEFAYSFKAPSIADHYNVDDLSSGDETDNDEHPRKIVPRWAQKSSVARHENIIRRHITEGQRERFFGRIKQPNICDFFDPKTKKYPLRNSSAVWTSPMSDPTPGESRFFQFNKKI